MAAAKYSVNQHPIQTLLSWINAGEIAIPEIQRPFVWNATQVRDLIDSLFQGYPVGYLIAWRNPDVKLKDGSMSAGKRILIDGQQRVTALMAAILGQYVVNKEYQRVRIKVAFQPIEQRFEVSNPAIQKDKIWLPDIAEVMGEKVSLMGLVQQYHSQNPETEMEEIFLSIERLRGLVNNQIGLIELNSDLNIETVTEIFIRINRQGSELSQADFAMSKIAANEEYGGNMLRKGIDYFCHLAVTPEFYPSVAENDRDFASSEYFPKIAWLKNENDDLYDPSYTDLLRVAFTSRFKRGRLSDLVALLSGRNFETREFEVAVAEQSFATLKEGVFDFMNETNFKRFVMILRSAGFIDNRLIGSQNAVNFAYIVYLLLRQDGTPAAGIESFTRKWYVMSILTERYSGNPEGSFDYDIRRIRELGFAGYFQSIEEAELSDTLWNVGLPQKLNTSVASSSFYRLYLAAQVKLGDHGFLSSAIKTSDLVLHRGDIHHIFPKNYLKKSGLLRGQYNQIANYCLMQSEINITVGDQSPAVYFSKLFEQCDTGEAQYGGITNMAQLLENFRMNCIPSGVEEMSLEDYPEFLAQRRKLMAQKMRMHYEGL